MKSLIYLIVLLFSLSSCEILDRDYNTYTIKNETNYSLVIKPYVRSYLRDTNKFDFGQVYSADEIRIAAYSHYFVEKETGEHWDPDGYFSNDYVDSVVIEFDHTKRLIYACDTSYLQACCEDRNIIDYYEFSDISCEKKRGCDFTYYITEDDYEAAEFIEDK